MEEITYLAMCYLVEVILCGILNLCRRRRKSRSKLAEV